MNRIATAVATQLCTMTAAAVILLTVAETWNWYLCLRECKRERGL